MRSFFVNMVETHILYKRKKDFTIIVCCFVISSTLDMPRIGSKWSEYHFSLQHLYLTKDTCRKDRANHPLRLQRFQTMFTQILPTDTMPDVQQKHRENMSVDIGAKTAHKIV